MSSTSTANSLKFINTSHPEDLRRGKIVRTEIRRHVMRDIGKHRRRKPQPTNDSKPSSPDNASVPTVRLDRSDTIVALSASGSIDRSLPPLGGFPVSTNARMFELARFLSETTSVYIPFRKIWFEISLSDPGAFHVTLGNAAVLEKTLHKEQDPLNSPEVKKHYAQSLVHLRKRLDHDAEILTDGAVANILAHVCLNMRTCNWKNWAVHMDGLELVYRARGGFEELPPDMKTMILWYDLAGAIVSDAVPRFPLPLIPVEFQPATRPMPFGLQLMLNSWAAESPCRVVLATIEAIQLFTSIADAVNLRSHSPLFWRHDVAALMLIGPCTHHLLSMPRYASNQRIQEFAVSRGDSALAELLRLNFLVTMSRLKELFSMFASERPILQEKLSTFLISNAKHLDLHQPDLKLAALITAYLMQEEEDLVNDGFHLASIADTMLAMGMRTATEALENTRQIFWINILHSPLEEKFANKLDHYITLLETT